MGLRTRLRAGETHALFEDECYAKSQEWKLSTSGLSAGGKFMGTGFGTGWPDGYGINCEFWEFGCLTVWSRTSRWTWCIGKGKRAHESMIDERQCRQDPFRLIEQTWQDPA